MEGLFYPLIPIAEEGATVRRARAEVTQPRGGLRICRA
jgi:hypothetical protein